MFITVLLLWTQRRSYFTENKTVFLSISSFNRGASALLHNALMENSSFKFRRWNIIFHTELWCYFVVTTIVMSIEFARLVSQLPLGSILEQVYWNIGTLGHHLLESIRGPIGFHFKAGIMEPGPLPVGTRKGSHCYHSSLPRCEL